MPEFVSEAIIPLASTANTAAMSRGEPGLPTAFNWRGQNHQVKTVVGNWKSYSHCQFNPKETYLRKHWYEIKTDTGLRAVIYFDRQPRSPSQRAARWVIYQTLDD